MIETREALRSRRRGVDSVGLNAEVMVAMESLRELLCVDDDILAVGMRAAPFPLAMLKLFCKGRMEKWEIPYYLPHWPPNGTVCRAAGTLSSILPDAKRTAAKAVGCSRASYRCNEDGESSWSCPVGRGGVGTRHLPAGVGFGVVCAGHMKYAHETSQCMSKDLHQAVALLHG
jgi:hypothetical protein